MIAFGCFRIENVTVPKGVALIGVPKAHDAIEQFGDAGVDRLFDMLSFAAGAPGANPVAVAA